ncbi:MAG: hypothetical protein B7Z54_02365 [Sphingobacteriales bacterium 12-47-4]|nr:MAG: hypothetical protein B7Z54_02365 [Sphingobacteriales bacterium 12-47-4]
MKTEKRIGLLLILGALGVFIPYTILTITFDYPNILRQETGSILTRFHEGGPSLIWTWWAFAILGLPLLVAYVLLGQKLETRYSFTRWATSIGVIGLVVQMIGLLRWVFVVPVLANNFVSGTEMARESSLVGFQLIHQYGGVVLGEHIGQLFTIIWTVLISAALLKANFIPRWVAWLGYLASFIYFLAQAELFATVIPGFPVWDLAGLIGSSLWLLWLIVLGVILLQSQRSL